MTAFIRGVRGETVKRLQSKLGLKDPNGIYNRKTEKAVREYQRKRGLEANGIAGADTFAALGLHELIMLRLGSKGAMVARLQEALGLETTGRFDRETDQALRVYQAENGLRVDGLAGPATLRKMGLFGSRATAFAALAHRAAGGAVNTVRGLLRRDHCA